MQTSKFFFFGLACVVLSVAPARLNATPYASNVQVTGTTVNFILNEPADVLTYSINGGPAVALNGATKGAKTFNLGVASDMFSIVAEKTAATGFTIPTGAVLPAENSTTAGQPANGLGHPTNEGGFNVVSDDASLLTRFNSPRGISISRNPNAPHFGTTYIANSAAGTQLASGRVLGDGLYALRADGSDAFGYGDTAQNPQNVIDGFPTFLETNANSPYRVTVADDGNVFVVDWSDANGNAFQVNPMLTESRNLFAGYGGPTPPLDAMMNPTTPDGTGLPETQNHGSVASIYAQGSLANNNLVVYTIDEDLNSAHVSGVTTDPKNDRNSVWRYNIGGTVPATAMPTKVAGGLIGFVPGGGVQVDLDFGADGKIYMSQFRAVQPSDAAGILVADPAGNIVFNSLEATRTLLNDPAANDIFRSVFGISVSPDQKWLAVMVNSSDVAVVPLVDGIPDIANRLLVNSAAPTGENTGRDISFDAAGNIHYASSGQGRYRVLAPGGHTIATTSFNGTQYSFNVQNITTPDGVAGDYNGNGVVDAADYVQWRNGGPLMNESASLGSVDDEDYTFWRSRFGATSAGSGSAQAAVPEPVGGLLCLICVLGLLLARRR
jgi:hypothetical protein